jgi:CheY-like chemotaxis protein
MDPTPPAPSATTDALEALRERYRAASARIVAWFRHVAAQLTVAPEAPQVLDAVRRELHRVHGTAGSYGFPEVSRLAGVLEERAVGWAADPAFDKGRRALIIGHFASALEARVCGTPPPPPMPGVQPQPASQQQPPPAPRPASPPARQPTPPRASGAIATGGPAARVPDVIVVEDDPSLADMLSYALGTTGYSFRHYANGPAALEALLVLDTAGRCPLVLLDVDLPGLDGVSLHERLRAKRPGVFAVVFMTVHAAEAEQIRAYRAGAMDYLVKPVNMRVLVAKLPSWIERAGGSARMKSG